MFLALHFNDSDEQINIKEVITGSMSKLPAIQEIIYEIKYPEGTYYYLQNVEKVFLFL